MKKITKSNPPRARKLYTPPATQNRILEEHLNGKSNREISKTTGMDRGTIGRVLSQPEIVEIVQKGRSQIVGIASDVPKVLAKGMASDDLRIAIPVALKLGDVTGILRPVEVPEPERDRERDRLVVLGQLVEMSIQKAKLYGWKPPSSLVGPFQSAEEFLEAHAKQQADPSTATLESADSGGS